MRTACCTRGRHTRGKRRPCTCSSSLGKGYASRRTTVKWGSSFGPRASSVELRAADRSAGSVSESFGAPRSEAASAARRCSNNSCRGSSTRGPAHSSTSKEISSSPSGSCTIRVTDMLTSRASGMPISVKKRRYVIHDETSLADRFCCGFGEEHEPPSGTLEFASPTEFPCLRNGADLLSRECEVRSHNPARPTRMSSWPNGC